jgi:hypothetical protein
MAAELISAVGDLAGSFIGAIMNWYGMQKQQEQADKINAQNLAQQGFSNNITKGGLAISQGGLAVSQASQRLAEKEFKYKKASEEEAAKWGKTVDFMNRMTTSFNQNPVARQRLMDINKQRSA